MRAAGFVGVFYYEIMAEGKKSVLLYCDLIHTIEKMDDETAGLFFKHYLRYVNDLNPETDNLVVDIAFESVKQNLKRDLKKWEQRAEKSRENGKKGGRPKKPNETQKTQQVISKPRKPDTVNVTVTDTVNVNGTVTETEIIKPTIDSRKLKFADTLRPYLEKYGRGMLTDFYEYWTEHNEDGKKMRFEYAKNQPFNVSRRLATWNKNNKNKSVTGKGTKKRGEGINADYLREIQERLNPSK